MNERIKLMGNLTSISDDYENLDISYKGTSFVLSNPPKPIGYWVLYPDNPHCTKFSMYSRPTDEQIKNTEELLGWGWENA